MDKKKYVLLGLALLLILLAGCGKKTTPTKDIKAVKVLPKIFDAAFLDHFTRGWIFAFLKGDEIKEVQELIGSNEGWQALFDGDIQSAITNFAEAKLVSDKTAYARTLLQRSSFYNENYRRALRYQERFLVYRQKHASLVKPSRRLFFYLGRVRFLAGEYQKALANLNFFLQTEEEDSFYIRGKVILGAVYYSMGDTGKAEALWDEMRKGAGDNLYFKSEWGFVQGYLGLNLKKALLHTRKAWRTAGKDDSADSDYFKFNLMYLKLLNGQLGAAQELGRGFDWQKPEYVETIEPQLNLRFYNPFHLRYLSLLDQEVCRELLESSDDVPYRDFYLGQVALTRLEYASARQLFESFIVSDPPRDLASLILSPYNTVEDLLISARFYLGEIDYLEQRPEKARRIWGDTFSASQNNPLVWINKAEKEAYFLGQSDTALKTAQMALDSARELDAALKARWLKKFDDETKDNFTMLLPFYLDQFVVRNSLLKLKEGKVFEGLQQLLEINDKQRGYNISGRNNPLFLMALSRAYYRQNRFNEVVGIYFSLLKKFPQLKQNYEHVKSIYATTTDSGETPR